MDSGRGSDNYQKKMTIDDVAAALGVSKTTVSRAISGKGRIGQETRERVLAYIDKHNYKPNVIAKGLANSKTYNVGIIIPEAYEIIDMPFFQKCIMGLCEIAGSMDYDVVMVMASNDNVSNVGRILADHKVDGIVHTRTLIEDETLELLQESGIPFVVIGRSYYDHVTQVDHDHREACKELTSILLMKNQGKMGLIGGEENHVITQTRLKGYMDGYQAAGKELDQSGIYLGVNSQVKANKVVDNLLEKGVECIVCMDDLICGYVLNKLRTDKIKVPEQIKIASFYNSTILDTYITPVTSLHFDVHEIGMQSGKILLDKIEGKEVAEKTLLEYEVVLKESTK